MENSITSTYSEFERNVRQDFQSSIVSINSRPKRRNTEDFDTTAASTETNYSTFARNIRPHGIFTSSALQQSNAEERESVSDFDISSISTGTTKSEFEENMRPGNELMSTNVTWEEDSTFEDETIISNDMNESSVSTYSEFARQIRNSSEVLQSTELSIKSRRNLKRQKTSDDFDTSASSTGTSYSSFARNVRPTGIFTSSKVNASHESNESNSDLNISSISTSTTYSDFQCNMRQGQDFRSSSLKGGEESFVMSSDEEEDQTLMSTDGGMNISLISTASTTYSGFERNMGPPGILTSSGIIERHPFASTPTKLVQLTFEDDESSSEEDGSCDDEVNDPDWKMSDAAILSELSSTLISSTPFKHPRQNAKATPQTSKTQAECQKGAENKENQIEMHSSTTDQSKRKTQPKPFSCSECSKQFKRKYILRLHVETHSKVRERFPCEICKRPFNQKGNSVYHKYTHMNSEELKQTNIYNKTCEICQHVFFNKMNYNDHINSHKGVKTYPCSKCSKSFTTKSHADKHILLVHATAEERKKIEESWKYSCEICNKKFSAPHHLETHKLSHSENKQFKCPTCEKEFKYKKGLKDHMKTHEEELLHNCEECDKKFSRLSNLKQHKLIHANKRDFKCGQCEKAFTRKADLVKHVNGVHLKLKPFICQRCNAAFSEKPNLKRHMKRIHKDFS